MASARASQTTTRRDAERLRYAITVDRTNTNERFGKDFPHSVRDRWAPAEAILCHIEDLLDHLHPMFAVASHQWLASTVLNRPMNANPPISTAAPADTPDQSKPDLDPIGQNIENILAFYAREEQNITRPQRTLETISGSLGHPYYLGAVVLFVALWILANVVADRLGFATFDPPPFPWLQGIVGLAALLTMVVVLIKQNRLAKLEERRAHLDLQVNLLTEQKTTKLINLIEELRRDLPMIKNRHDAEATAYQQPTDPESVLAALHQRFETGERSPGGNVNKGKVTRKKVSK